MNAVKVSTRSLKNCITSLGEGFREYDMYTKAFDLLANSKWLTLYA